MKDYSVRTYCCGPLQSTIVAESPELANRAAVPFRHYNVLWPKNALNYVIKISTGNATESAQGGYLTCACMKVDKTPKGILATSTSGASCQFDERAREWMIKIPHALDREKQGDALEDFINLALTSGWRTAGWLPVHAAAIVKGNSCAVLCATSGGGKSTLTAAMVRRGWLTLGDDKLLLRMDAEKKPELRALLHSFNLHPRTRDWFPEVGDLTLLPQYSHWTAKRKVSVDSIWPGQTTTVARPNHIVEVVRSSEHNAVKVSSLGKSALLALLLRQTVIPSDTAIAAETIKIVAATVHNAKGWRVEIGDGAYSESGWHEQLEECLL